MSDFDDGSFVAAIDKGRNVGCIVLQTLVFSCISQKGLSDCLGTVASRRQYFQDIGSPVALCGMLSLGTAGGATGACFKRAAAGSLGPCTS